MVQVSVLEIIYICAEGLLVFVLVPACGVATLILDFPYLSWHTSRSKKISLFFVVVVHALEPPGAVVNVLPLVKSPAAVNSR